MTTKISENVDRCEKLRETIAALSPSVSILVEELKDLGLSLREAENAESCLIGAQFYVNQVKSILLDRVLEEEENENPRAAVK